MSVGIEYMDLCKASRSLAACAWRIAELSGSQIIRNHSAGAAMMDSLG